MWRGAGLGWAGPGWAAPPAVSEARGMDGGPRSGQRRRVAQVRRLGGCGWPPVGAGGAPSSEGWKIRGVRGGGRSRPRSALLGDGRLCSPCVVLWWFYFYLSHLRSGVAFPLAAAFVPPSFSPAPRGRPPFPALLLPASGGRGVGGLPVGRRPTVASKNTGSGGLEWGYGAPGPGFAFPSSVVKRFAGRS